MFRITNTLRSLTVASTNLPQANTNLITVRFKRKPLWMPTAKSKLFRIPPRPVIPDEELEEIKRLYNNYRTQIKSIRRYLTYQHATRLQQTVDTEHQATEFAEDFARCTKLNDEWNKRLEPVRSERYAKELAHELEVARSRIEEGRIRDAARLEEVEEIVRREKRAAVNFITRENLDEAIERAIANPIDFNFAIDPEGNRIEGREKTPEDSQTDEKISVKQ